MGRRHAAVYERDNWQCQMPACLCPDGRDINPALYGLDNPWAPSVDHVVLRSEGGPGSQENLRAAHRQCNMSAAGIPVARPRKGPFRRSRHLSYKIGDLFPGDQGSAWS